MLNHFSLLLQVKNKPYQRVENMQGAVTNSIDKSASVEQFCLGSES